MKTPLKWPSTVTICLSAQNLQIMTINVKKYQEIAPMIKGFVEWPKTVRIDSHIQKL
jgi:hypothetical protein